MKFESVLRLLLFLFIFFPFDALAGTNTAIIAENENSLFGSKSKPLCINLHSSFEVPIHSKDLFFSLPTNMAALDNHGIDLTAGTFEVSIIRNAIELIQTLYATGTALVSSGTASSTPFLFGTGIVGLIGISRRS